MSDPFVGEIRMFAGNFAPQNWAFCNGQLLPISANNALFSLLGTIYGGDGRTTFALPDLRGRLPMHQGSGAGLSPRSIGQRSGVETVTINRDQLPAHSHVLGQANTRADTANPDGNLLARSATGDLQFKNSAGDSVTMSNEAIGSTGGSRSHNNMPPFLCIQFIIALVGYYPSRS